MPKKRTQKDAPLFEADDNVNTNDDFVAKKNSIEANFSKKKIDRNAPYHQSKTYEKKINKAIAENDVLFDYTNDNQVDEAKKKVENRIKKANQEHPDGSIKIQTSENSRPSSVTSSTAINPTGSQPLSSDISPSENTPELQSVKDTNVTNVDEKAKAIKMALERRMRDEASTEITKKPQVQNQTKEDNDEPLIKLGSLPTVESEKPIETVATVQIQEEKPEKIEKPVQPAARPVTKKPPIKRTASHAVTFDDLMKVLDDEKKKLK
jgi:hypothetical protein